MGTLPIGHMSLASLSPLGKSSSKCRDEKLVERGRAFAHFTDGDTVLPTDEAKTPTPTQL